MALGICHHEDYAFVIAVPNTCPSSAKSLDLAASGCDVIYLYVEVNSYF